MSEDGRVSSSRRMRLVIGAVVVVVIAVSLAAGLIFSLQSGDDGAPVESGPTSSSPGPGSVQVDVAGSTILTVPDTIQMPSGSFATEAGATYLLQFEVSIVKPPESPGDAMYFGASLACGNDEQGTVRSIGGTQNVLTGQNVTLRNQFLLEAAETAEYSCRMSVFAPNPDVDARGTSADVDTRWTASSVGRTAFEPPADDKLPRVMDPDQRGAAFVFELDLVPGRDVQFELLGTLHITTCTEVEGSTEDDRTWCVKDEIDEGGSSAEITYRAVLLDVDGEACDRQILDVNREHTDRRVHHQVLHVAPSAEFPADRCGDQVRIEVEVENHGPAPLLIHRSSSNIVTQTS